MTPSTKDFVGPILPRKGLLNGINGTLPVKGVGTIKWKVLDDQGKEHDWLIKDSLYVPGLSMRLMSPQHWASQFHDNERAWCTTFKNSVILHWNKNKFKKTIKLDGQQNVPVMKSAGGIRNYSAFANLLQSEEEMRKRECVCCRVATVHDKTEVRDEEDLLFPMNDAKQIPDEEENQVIGIDDRAELVRWHYRLGHLPYERMKILMKLGHLPKRLLKVKPPRCAGCMFGAMTKRPWTNQPKSKRSTIKVATQPGEIVPKRLF